MCPKMYSAYLVYSRAEKSNNMILTRRKKRQNKTTFENDSDDIIPKSVSKLNKIMFYNNTDSGSWKFVV